MTDGAAGVAAVAAVVVGCGALAAGCAGDDDSGSGPLAAPNPHGWTITRPVGSVFTDGVETLRLTGDRPAVLRDVRVVGTDGLKVVGISLVAPGRRFASIQEIDGWPPRSRYLDPATVVPRGVGATFTPSRTNPEEQSYELLVGLKVVKPGYLVRKGLLVTYTVDGRTHTRFLPAELAVCTSTTMETRDGCPTPE